MNIQTVKQIAALKLFNEKAQELVESSFVRTLNSPNAGVTISWQQFETGGGELRSEVRGPYYESVQAFVLTFRFFIQNNERSSLGQIASVYESASVDAQLKKQFESARHAINAMLDSANPFNVTHNENKPTNREVMEVFVYGKLAHAEPQKEQKYNEWKSDPVVGPLLLTCFYGILRNVLNALAYISRVNTEAILLLEEQV